MNQSQQHVDSFMQLLKQVVATTETKVQEGSKPLALTVKDAADELQVSIPTLRDHFLCRPDFPKIRAGTKVLIPRRAFEAWINGQC